MALAALKQKQVKPEAHLSMDELKNILSEVGVLLRKDIRLAKESFELPFLRDNYIRVIRKNIMPTPKQQFYIVQCSKEVKKRALKKYPELFDNGKFVVAG